MADIDSLLIEQYHLLAKSNELISFDNITVSEYSTNGRLLIKATEKIREAEQINLKLGQILKEKGIAFK